MDDTARITEATQATIAATRAEQERLRAVRESLLTVTQAVRVTQKQDLAVKYAIDSMRDLGQTLDEISQKTGVSKGELRAWGATQVRSLRDLTNIPLNRLFRDLNEGMLKFSLMGPLATGAIIDLGRRTFNFWDQSRVAVNKALSSFPQQLGVGGYSSTPGTLGMNTRVALPSNLQARTSQDLKYLFSTLGFSFEDATRGTSSLGYFGRRGTPSDLTGMLKYAGQLSRDTGTDIATNTKFLSTLMQRGGGTAGATGLLGEFLTGRGTSILSKTRYQEDVSAAYDTVYRFGGGLREAQKAVDKFSKSIFYGAISAERATAFRSGTFEGVSPGAQAYLLQNASRLGIGGLGGFSNLPPLQLAALSSLGVFNKVMSPEVIVKTLRGTGALGSGTMLDQVSKALYMMQSIGVDMGKDSTERRAKLESLAKGFGTTPGGLEKALGKKGLFNFQDVGQGAPEELKKLKESAGLASEAFRAFTERISSWVDYAKLELHDRQDIESKRWNSLTPQQRMSEQISQLEGGSLYEAMDKVLDKLVDKFFSKMQGGASIKTDTPPSETPK